MLKERRTLVLVPRENTTVRDPPGNMLKPPAMGARIVPRHAASNHSPASVDEMVDFVVGKTMDLSRGSSSPLPRLGDAGTAMSSLSPPDGKRFKG